MNPVTCATAASFVFIAASFPAAGAPTPAEKGEGPPWRGSVATYGHAATALSLSKSAEPFYNPFYGHRLELQPEWHFGQQLFLRGKLELSQELTLSDETTYRHEVVWSDLAVEVGAEGVDDPWLGVRAAGTLRLTAPLSKVSAAQTKLFSLGPGISLTRKFPVRSGLTARLESRLTQSFHRFTTTQFSAPTIAACGDLRDQSCGELAHSGARNVRSELGAAATVSFEPIEKLSATARFQLSQGWLYPLAEVRLNGAENLPTTGEVGLRHTWGLVLEASYQLLPYLTASLGSSTIAPQLAPDGTRRTPFFNRYTTLYLDLGLDFEAVLSRK
ncbi:MAG: hypothetical protein HYZ28_14050 [Myxococcales bacterium]|nr:hypothetical protein [Myxococcales bacterium]